jgi:pSer/pThr/pTyr-binding forkhead associated (FHA) protein
MEEAEAPSPTRVFKPPVAATAAVSAQEAEQLGLAHEPRAFLNVGGKRQELPKEGAVLGRSREADVTLEDANVSRRHAEIRREDGVWWIVDLGSTNGVELNGKRVDRAKLTHDDHLVLGRSEVVFEQPE